MAILASDLQVWRLGSDGKLGSSRLSSNTLENVFANLTGVQNRDTVVNHVVVAFLNNHASLPLTSAKLYFRVVNSGGANLAIALDAIGPAVKTGQLWTPGQTPATFVAPSTVGSGLSIGTLNPGHAVAVWIRRTPTGSGAVRPEKNTLTITGTTAP